MTGQEELVAVDIGGTHARFALARIEGGRVALGAETVLRTGDFAGLGEAWAAFGAGIGRALPRRAGIAVAGPVDESGARLTNSPWVIRPDALVLESVTLVNDFAAVAHAVAVCGPEYLAQLCGPDRPLPELGAISVVGPGTGLGVALLHREAGGDAVVATEGGHIGFAPTDDVEDRLLARLRARHGRVSVERVVAGAGLRAIVGGVDPRDDAALWTAALAGGDPALDAALARYCGLLGGVAGDLALAHGAAGVVIAGGLGLRLKDVMPGSPFAARFLDKGRMQERLAALPVKLLTHPQPGLLGAAAAFAADVKRAPLQG